MKEKKYLIPMIISITVLSTLIWLTMIKPRFEENQIKVGQVYKYVIDEEDPFKKPHVHYYRILNVKEGFVQYYDSTWRDTSSMRASTFIWSASLIK